MPRPAHSEGVAYDTARMLDERIEELAAWLGLAGTLEGNDLVCLNPTRPDTRAGSFRIQVRGSWRGAWKEFAGNVSGDALDLIAYIRRTDKREALRIGREFLGGDAPTGDVAPARHPQAVAVMAAREAAAIEERARKTRAARARWLGANPVIAGSPVDCYLMARGLAVRALGKQPGALRYHPDLREPHGKRHFNAMVACMLDGDGQIQACHATYLARGDGVWGKAGDVAGSGKAILGSWKGAFIPIWRGRSGLPFAAAPADDTLAITEGIEDALTIALAMPDWRIWAAGVVGNLAGLPVPSRIRTVRLILDNDQPGSDAAKVASAAIDHYARSGHVVYPTWAGGGAKDFNDRLRR